MSVLLSQFIPPSPFHQKSVLCLHLHRCPADLHEEILDALSFSFLLKSEL